MIFQMQFVSLLRLLDTNISVPFMNFINDLKWLNLHFEIELQIFDCAKVGAALPTVLPFCMPVCHRRCYRHCQPPPTLIIYVATNSGPERAFKVEYFPL